MKFKKYRLHKTGYLYLGVDGRGRGSVGSVLGLDGLVEPALVIERPLPGVRQHAVGLAHLLEPPGVEAADVLLRNCVKVS